MSTTLTAPVPVTYSGKLIAADKLAALESLAASQVNALAHPGKGAIFGPVFQRAEAVETMREMLTAEVMQPIMKLQGSRLGFRTDKDKVPVDPKKPEGPCGYPLTVVRDCLIEGILLGARPCGNEINIIAGNCYLTREYFLRQLREWPGLTDLVIELLVPVITANGALVEARATWSINGKPDSVWCRKVSKSETREESDSRISVKVNAGMGTDAILGKAERKLGAKIWRKLTGSETTVEGDADDSEIPIRIPSRTLEIPPESPPTDKAPPVSRTPTSTYQPPTDVELEAPQSESGPREASKLAERIEAATDQVGLRRVNAARVKALASGLIDETENDKLQVMLQEAKRHLPSDS